MRELAEPRFDPVGQRRGLDRIGRHRAPDVAIDDDRGAGARADPGPAGSVGDRAYSAKSSILADVLALAGFLVFVVLHWFAQAENDVWGRRFAVAGVFSALVGAGVAYTTNYLNQSVWTFGANGRALVVAAFTVATTGPLVTGLLGAGSTTTTRWSTTRSRRPRRPLRPTPRQPPRPRQRRTRRANVLARAQPMPPRLRPPPGSPAPAPTRPAPTPRPIGSHPQHTRLTNRGHEPAHAPHRQRRQRVGRGASERWHHVGHSRGASRSAEIGITDRRTERVARKRSVRAPRARPSRRCRGYAPVRPA